MRDSLYTIFYAAALGTVCALLLTGVGGATRQYRQTNAKAEEVRTILDVLGVPFKDGASAQELVQVFESSVRQANPGNPSVYEYLSQDGSTVQAVAVPLAGQGLWGPVKGFLALESDGRTIRGITFHEQEETPGLGGEIAAPWFRKQFNGKQIVDAEGKPGIRILSGKKAAGPNEVDAITGATMTSKAVEKLINAAIERVVKEQESHAR